jgi:hypothetical protein
MVEGRIFSKEPIKDSAEQERAGTFESSLVDRHGNLDPAGGADADALANTTHDRPAIHGSDAAKSSLGGGVFHIREHRQRFPQRLSIAARTALDKAEMIGAEHINEPPGNRAGVRRLAAAAQLRYDRLTRWRRARNAHEVER